MRYANPSKGKRQSGIAGFVSLFQFDNSSEVIKPPSMQFNFNIFN